ncbi:MAG: hypothetical protein M1814_002587 [Vezdaea aestivalis]|nr:MAG: hypothetical protein M1814_002587 [Vezdaea aestivalis]
MDSQSSKFPDQRNAGQVSPYSDGAALVRPARAQENTDRSGPPRKRVRIGDITISTTAHGRGANMAPAPRLPKGGANAPPQTQARRTGAAPAAIPTIQPVGSNEPIQANLRAQTQINSTLNRLTAGVNQVHSPQPGGTVTKSSMAQLQAQITTMDAEANGLRDRVTNGEIQLRQAETRSNEVVNRIGNLQVDVEE